MTPGPARLGRWPALIALPVLALALTVAAVPRRGRVAWQGNGRAELLDATGVVLQAGPNDCGLAALATLFGELGAPVSVGGFGHAIAPGADGTTMLVLRDLAWEHGLALQGVSAAGRAADLPPPWIAHLRSRRGHFVVVEGRAGADWVVADPGIGRLRVSDSDFRRHWSGNALVLDTAAGARAGDPRR